MIVSSQAERSEYCSKFNSTCFLNLLIYIFWCFTLNRSGCFTLKGMQYFLDKPSKLGNIKRYLHVSNKQTLTDDWKCRLQVHYYSILSWVVKRTELSSGRSKITDSTAFLITTTWYCLLLESWKTDSKPTFSLKIYHTLDITVSCSLHFRSWNKLFIC